MFGKLCDVIISKSDGNSLVLCNHKDQPNTYYCSGTIERYPQETDKLTISIYNLPASVRGQIALQNYSLITVLWGYKDEGDDKLGELFVGNIQRLIYQKQDAVSNTVKIWAYDTGQFKSLSFFSGSYKDGANYYQIAQEILTQGGANNPEAIALSDKLKEYAVRGNESYYGSSDDAMKQIADENGFVYKSTHKQVSMMLPSEIVSQDTAIQFSFYDESTRRVESKSGLVNIPTLSDDGLYLECLVNSNIYINTLIQIDNSVISIEQEGAIPQAEYGASLDPDGIYVVVQFTCNFNNGGEENTMRLKAYSRSVYLQQHETGEEQ